MSIVFRAPRRIAILPSLLGRAGIWIMDTQIRRYQARPCMQRTQLTRMFDKCDKEMLVTVARLLANLPALQSNRSGSWVLFISITSHKFRPLTRTCGKFRRQQGAEKQSPKKPLGKGKIFYAGPKPEFRPIDPLQSEIRLTSLHEF